MLDGMEVTEDPSLVIGEPAGFFGEVSPIRLETPEESKAKDELQARRDVMKTYNGIMKKARSVGYRE